MKQSNNRIIFFGSSSYSAIVAEKLHKTFGLQAVVTIPDKPVGRKQILTPSPVKIFAQENNITTITADKLDETRKHQLEKLEPDFFVVADYGIIMPHAILQIPRFAPLNVHHSLLPKYRGPSPAPAAILAEEKMSGVTIIHMNDKVDDGDILAQETYQLSPDETTQSLLTTLNTIGGNLVVNVIQNFATIQPSKQNEKDATFTKRYTKQDSFVDSNNPPAPEMISRMTRAFYPWPIAWTTFITGDKQIRIKLLPKNLIQPEGKNPMTYKDFMNGYKEGKEFLEKLGLM